MNKTTKALKLAEEALYAELESDTCEEFAEAAEKCHKALAAIREALAEPDTKSGELHAMKTELWKAEHSGDANEMVVDTNPLSVFAKECVLGAYTYDELPEAARLALKRAKKAEPVKQEPVAFVSDVHLSRYTLEWNSQPLPEGTELYAAPVSAKREWVELTPIELAEAFVDKGSADSGIRAVIAAFKEKNK